MNKIILLYSNGEYQTRSPEHIPYALKLGSLRPILVLIDKTTPESIRDKLISALHPIEGKLNYYG